MNNKKQISVRINLTNDEWLSVNEMRREYSHISRIVCSLSRVSRLRCPCETCMAEKSELATQADNAIANILKGDRFINFSDAYSLFEWLHTVRKDDEQPQSKAMFKISSDARSLRTGLMKMYHATGFA